MAILTKFGVFLADQDAYGQRIHLTMAGKNNY